jgi:hypothetical protein
LVSIDIIDEIKSVVQEPALPSLQKLIGHSSVFNAFEKKSVYPLTIGEGFPVDYRVWKLNEYGLDIAGGDLTEYEFVHIDCVERHYVESHCSPMLLLLQSLSQLFEVQELAPEFVQQNKVPAEFY